MLIIIGGLDVILEITGIRIAISTIGKVLERLKLLIQKRKFKTQKKNTRCYNLLIPGEQVQMDVKYVPSELSPFGRSDTKIKPLSLFGIRVHKVKPFIFKGNPFFVSVSKLLMIDKGLTP